MKKSFILIIAYVAAIFLNSCDKEPSFKVEDISNIHEPQNTELNIILGTGIISYVNLEGGFYGIIGHNGKFYYPINLDKHFNIKGLKVQYKALVRNDLSNFYMWNPLEIMELKMLSDPMKYITIDKGDNCQKYEKTAVKIDSQDDWSAFWEEVHRFKVPEPPMPSIDFDQYTILSVFMGNYMTDGYSIEITDFLEKKFEIIAYYTETYPDSDDFIQQKLTQPYHIIRIEKTGKPVTFVKK